MSIFNFSEEQSLGEVRSVETSRITVRVTDGQRLQKARVGRLVAIQSVGDEWLIGIIERVWRHPVELPSFPEVDETIDLSAVPQEENGISISLVGTYRSRDGLR
ncbi:TPA: ATP-binding protein, partial [Escherichia coli]|nr:ATP-binding protein [Escherichia coli]